METPWRKHSTFILFIFPGVLTQIQMPVRNMEVIEGQMVVLRAWYTPGFGGMDKNTVLWNFVNNNSQLIISYSSNSISLGSPQFDQRVGFVHIMPSANLSLYINNTQEVDSGRYLAQVIVPGGQGLTGELTLIVKVPPSVPECTLKGKPVLKGNVSLTCSSKSGKPTPLYKWTKTGPISEVFFSPMLNEKTGTLTLNNLSSNMSGKYVCKASNTAGTESCFVNLEVITATNAGIIAGATVGAILGVVFIILFLFCILRRRRDTEEDLANEIKEDAQAPKRVSWAKSGTGSDTASKNGTLSSVTNSPHSHGQYYTHQHHPASDTASVTTTGAGSMAGYRPHPGLATPIYGLPGHNSSSPRGPPVPPPGAANGNAPPRTERAQPQAPRPPLLPTGVTTSNIARMGGVPIMVPAQNQAGSLV